MTMANSAEMTVFVELPNGEVIPFIVLPNSTVEKIKGKVSDMNSIPPNLMTLIYANRILPDDAIARECGLTNNCRILVAIPQDYGLPTEIAVAFTNRSSVNVCMNNKADIAALKKEIKKQTGISVKAQTLTFGLKQLDDKDSLYSCGLSLASTVICKENVSMLRAVCDFISPNKNK